jgi:cytochrome c
MRTEATVPEAPPPSELQNLKNPLGVTPANIQAGKQLYDRSCWVCHGLNGKGDGPAAPSLPQMPIDFTSDHDFQTETDGQVFWLTFNGIKGTDMPGFKDTFSNDEIWQIESYIIQFRSNPANRRGFGQSGTTRFTGTTSAGGTTSTSMAGTTSSS